MGKDCKPSYQVAVRARRTPEWVRKSPTGALQMPGVQSLNPAMRDLQAWTRAYPAERGPPSLSPHGLM
jgi:hypothetical protein